MFGHVPTESDRTLRVTILAVLTLSLTALLVTVWVMVDFLAEQAIVADLIEELPAAARDQAEALAGELRWQFRLSTLIVLNLVVTAFAIVMLSRAYRSSQRSLRDLQFLAGDVLNSMDQAVITTDNQGRVTSINQPGMEMLNTSLQCLSRPLSEVQGDLALVGLLREAADRDRHRPTSDFEFSTPGSQRILRGFCQPLQNREGHHIGHVLELRDVTEQVLVDQRLRRMERYMGLGSLAAGLHHEIKNPLAALSLHVQLLEERLGQENTDPEVDQMLGVIRAEVNRVGGVLEGFRDFAAMDDLNLTTVDLPRLLQRQAGFLAPRAQQAGIDLEIKTEEGVPLVTADEVRLEQVLLNLLLNAMESMPQGGKLTLAAQSVANQVVLSVTDTGGGIPADLQDRILDPYFTTKSQGTGMGLALCDKIVRQHGGTLEFQSSPGGTTFEVRIPQSTPDDQPPTPAMPSGPEPIEPA